MFLCLFTDLCCNHQNISSDYYDLWLTLKSTVEKESSYMKTLFELMGSMDTLFAAASQPVLTNENDSSVSRDDVLKPSHSAQTTIW